MEGEWRIAHFSKEVKDDGTVNGFLDRTLKTFWALAFLVCQFKTASYCLGSSGCPEAVTGDWIKGLEVRVFELSARMCAKMTHASLVKNPWSGPWNFVGRMDILREGRGIVETWLTVWTVEMTEISSESEDSQDSAIRKAVWSSCADCSEKLDSTSSFSDNKEECWRCWISRTALDGLWGQVRAKWPRFLSFLQELESLCVC